MKPLTKEWAQKAEGDYASALREVRARKNPNFDSACFHAQQCAEKYMKALLQESEIVFGRTHDLTVLLGLLPERYQNLKLYKEALRKLTVFAVEFRYPGEFADRDNAREAVKVAEEIRKEIRSILRIRS